MAASRRARLLVSPCAAQIKGRAGAPISCKICCAALATISSWSVINSPTPRTTGPPTLINAVSAPRRRSSIRSDSSRPLSTIRCQSGLRARRARASETSSTRCASSKPSSKAGTLMSTRSLVNTSSSASWARSGSVMPKRRTTCDRVAGF